ncbi:hypothetical protein ENU1_144240 [Entamoeba nuttalli P19]|uniref:Uncharacterized protein n=1 Tax=Entamoeba nuttalli (strain P19) TaxID=1076696 RepID=K2GYV3_ENTNP|nr:hypothetical protein ENU1_144240 [Entamoeba nuttalli P19]EKE39027.1 hypothetical protein ENU1_144240 [Entamoeba nuttalli P19]|eukprot:XP_008858647.1 hypothetical protein ENU1_144240 [Entamoeba nuttalli P19]
MNTYPWDITLKSNEQEELIDALNFIIGVSGSHEQVNEIQHCFDTVLKYYPGIKKGESSLEFCKNIKNYFIEYFDKKLQVIDDMLNLIRDMYFFCDSERTIDIYNEFLSQQINTICFLKNIPSILQEFQSVKTKSEWGHFEKSAKDFISEYMKSENIELESDLNKRMVCKIPKKPKEKELKEKELKEKKSKEKKSKEKKLSFFNTGKSSELESEISKLKEEKEKIQTEYNTYKKLKDQELIKLNEINETTMSQMKKHEEECSKVIQDFKKVSHKFEDEKQRQLNEFEQKLKEIKIQNEQDVTHIYAETKEIQKEIKALKKDIETKNKKYNDLSQQLDGLKKQLYDCLMMQNIPKGVIFKLKTNTEYFIILASSLSEHKVSLPRVNQCMLGGSFEVELYQLDLQSCSFDNQITFQEQGSQLSNEKRYDVRIEVIERSEDEKKEEEIVECIDNHPKHQLFQQIVEIPLSTFLTGGAVEVSVANNSLIVPILVGEKEGLSLTYGSVSTDSDGNIIDVVLKTKYLDDPHYQRVGDDLIGVFQYSQENAGETIPIPYIVEGQSLGDFVLQTGKYRYQGYGFSSPTGIRGDYWLHVKLI